ncbi:MAG: hypothetical protein FJ386_03905 [Verrucomicrobia bacterium]|nr:hypothetical protein [Verrucomicrobiota bacterium]
MTLARLPLLLAAFTAAAAAQDFEIRLHRPLKAGDRFAITKTVHEETETALSAGGKAVTNRREKLLIEFKSEATVEEVDAKGKPQRFTHKVSNLALTVGAERKQLLGGGAVVKAFLEDGKPVFEAAGERATGELARALSAAASVGKSGASDDEFFGTKERKKVGDSWNVNAAAMIKDMQAKGNLRAENLAGKVTLEKVTTDGGKRILHLGSEVKGSFFPPLPPGLTIKESTMRIKLGAKVPASVTDTHTEEEGDVSFALIATGKPDPNGAEVELKSSQRRWGTSAQIPIK